MRLRIRSFERVPPYWRGTLSPCVVGALNQISMKIIVIFERVLILTVTVTDSLLYLCSTMSLSTFARLYNRIASIDVGWLKNTLRIPPLIPPEKVICVETQNLTLIRSVNMPIRIQITIKRKAYWTRATTITSNTIRGCSGFWLKWNFLL